MLPFCFIKQKAEWLALNLNLEQEMNELAAHLKKVNSPGSLKTQLSISLC